MDLGPEPSTTQYLEALRTYAVQSVDPELLEDRLEVWDILGDHGPDFGTGSRAPPGDWWCLRASEDFVEHKGLLMRDLQCDYDSVSYFVRLVRTGKPEGYMEALRILHHFLKDKDLATTPHDPQRPLSVQNSKWLKGACLEAPEAISNPQDWEQGPAINAKGALKGGKGTWSPFEDPAGGKGSSSSSSRSTSRRTGWRG